MNESNIAFNVTWIDSYDQDDLLIEMNVDAFCSTGWMRNEIMASTGQLIDLGDLFIEHARDYAETHGMDFGVTVSEPGSSTRPRPPITFRLKPADLRGYIPVLVDMKVQGNPDPEARCEMCLTVEVGMLERFGHAVVNLGNRKQLTSCTLSDFYPLGMDEFEVMA